MSKKKKSKDHADVLCELLGISPDRVKSAKMEIGPGVVHVTVVEFT